MSKQIVEVLHESDTHCLVYVEGKAQCHMPIRAINLIQGLQIIFSELVIENVDIKLKVNK